MSVHSSLFLCRTYHEDWLSKFIKPFSVLVCKLPDDSDQRKIFTREIVLCLVYHHLGTAEGIPIAFLPLVRWTVCVGTCDAINHLIADGDALLRSAVVILLYHRIFYPVILQKYQTLVLVFFFEAYDVIDGLLLLHVHVLKRGLLLAVLYNRS